MQKIKARKMEVWNDSWYAYQNRVIEPSIAQSVLLSKKRLKIHTQQKKAESALITKIRTAKIGLADFLYRRRVPFVTLPACLYGWHRQTPEHIIMFYRLIGNSEQIFRAAGTSDYQHLIKVFMNSEDTNCLANENRLIESILTNINIIIKSTIVEPFFLSSLSQGIIDIQKSLILF